MRGYSVVAAALALSVDPKWLDNVLSQHRVEGVAQTRQGVQRRLAPSALYLIATVHTLNRELQVPVGGALSIAHALWRDPPEAGESDQGIHRIEGISLRIDRSEIKARVDAALAEAVEIAPRPRRGRPPRKRTI